MATSWQEAVETGAPVPESAPAPEEGERRGAFKRLRESLGRSRQALQAELSASIADRIDAEAFEGIEEALIMADLGAPATADVVGTLEAEVESGEVSGGEAVRERLIELLAGLAESERPRIDLTARPAVVMVVGVNGTGKTTTIGKLAWHLREELGLSVLVAAADTYRAAAIEQLETWAGRSGVDIVKGSPGGDAGAVVFDAIAAAEARGIDVVLADTAGRLHTHGNLMEELSKVRKVTASRLEGAPHETLLVDRRHHGPERAPPGASVCRGGGGDRSRAHEARRDREGRHRAGDLPRAGHPREADRGGGGHRGPAALRRPRIRRRAHRNLSHTPRYRP